MNTDKDSPFAVTPNSTQNPPTDINTLNNAKPQALNAELSQLSQQSTQPQINNPHLLTDAEVEKNNNKSSSNLPQIINNNDIQENNDEVFTVVEEYPSFPGGEKARIKFLQQNIHYPKEALQNHVQGKVVINFIVEKDGSVSNMRLLDSIGKGCDKEALRVAKLMPKWKPGKQRGVPVRVSFNMPVTFRLSL